MVLGPYENFVCSPKTLVELSVCYWISMEHFVWSRVLTEIFMQSWVLTGTFLAVSCHYKNFKCGPRSIRELYVQSPFHRRTSRAASGPP